jgi:signal transduction histidine kinase
MTSDSDNLKRLLGIGRSLVAELDPEEVLLSILAESRQLTGARYAALGVVDEQRTGLERFLTLGIDDGTRAVIGDLPRGRGVLGALIQHPEPLRLAHVGEHPQSYGFPSGHPRMESFLGVPVVIRGEVWGNLYLTEKQDGAGFTADDEAAVVILADLAATAIDNARIYARSEERRLALEQAVHGLEASRDIADAIGSAADLEQILELVVERGRTLIGAQTVLVLLREGDQLVVAASAGQVRDARGRRVPIAGSTAGQVLERRQPERISNAVNRMRIAPEELGVIDAHTALLMPLIHKGAGLGVLVAFDRGTDGDSFSDADEQLLRTFAAAASNAVAIRRSVEADRLSSTIAAAEAERARWARELHDQTLQALAGLRVGLSGALRRDEHETYVETTRQALQDIELEIGNLRAIIADLRPSLLDDVGLRDALQALIDRRRGEGVSISFGVELPEVLAGAAPEVRALETAVYRLVQESLTNVVKHAAAASVTVNVFADAESLTVEVRDDGIGFDTSSSTSGFGLAGMRERVFLLGGTLDVTSGDGGTRMTTRIPLPAMLPRSGAERAAS